MKRVNFIKAGLGMVALAVGIGLGNYISKEEKLDCFLLSTDSFNCRR